MLGESGANQRIVSRTFQIWFQTWNNVEDPWHLAFFKTRFIGKGTSYWPWVYQNIFYCFRQKLMKRSCSCVMTILWLRMNTSLTDIQDHSTQSSTFTELGNFTLLMRCVFLHFSKKKNIKYFWQEYIFKKISGKILITGWLTRAGWMNVAGEMI